MEHRALAIPGYRLNCSPYSFSRFVFDSELSKFLGKNEPHERNIKKFKGRSHTKLLPTSFSWERPGPCEDPILREEWLKRKKFRMNLESDPNLIFGFDSLEQCRSWWFDKEEIFCLGKNGFIVDEYRVKTKFILKGLRQTICIFDEKEPPKFRDRHSMMFVFSEFYKTIDWSLNDKDQPVKINPEPSLDFVI
jgi:hypothetical protein